MESNYSIKLDDFAGEMGFFPGSGYLSFTFFEESGKEVERMELPGWEISPVGSDGNFQLPGMD